MATKKFDEDARNFETRVSFIRDIFMNKYDQDAIMAHCIEHKLDWSYLQYVKELHRSAWNLNGDDPIQILKRIDRNKGE